MTVLRRTRATAAGAAGHHQDGSPQPHLVTSIKEESSSGGVVATKRRTSLNTTTATTTPTSTLFTKKKRNSLAGDTGIAEEQQEEEGSSSRQQQQEKKKMASSANSSTTLRKGKGRVDTSIAAEDGKDSPATSSTSSSSSSARSARSGSRRRHAIGGEDGEQEEEEQQQPSSTQVVVHEVSDNVLQAQGLSSISTSLIDNLPDCTFPKKGISLHPNDLNDPLLILCGKVLASVSNRALTPKEIALILARRHGWQFNGSQPFAVVSSCIRSHVRRASLAQPPYHPIFTPYELSSVPPVEDIPCLGIEADSKPVVKRGTFWFLSEDMGYGYPFPHKRAAASMKAVTGASSLATSMSSATSTSASTPTSSTSTPQQAQTQPSQQGHHRRSSLRHQPQPIAPAQPIPIMPAPPQHTTTSFSSSSLPTLAPRTKSDGKTDRLTRAQKSAQSTISTSTTGNSHQKQHILPSPVTLVQSAPVASSILDRSKAAAGKRKRTTSKAPSFPADASSTLALNDASGNTAYPHLQQLPAGASAAAQPNTQAWVAGATAKNGSRKLLSSKRGTGSAVHRRAFSSSAGDGVSTKPIPALRKLKLRLSAVSESAVMDDVSSASDRSLLSTSVPASGSVKSATKKATLSGKPSTTSTKQSKKKRARTQSMSSLHTSTTASFPFDDLHLYHSMQQQQPIQASPSTYSSITGGEGTLYPFEMHMQLPHSSSSGGDASLNLFSPGMVAAAAAAGSTQAAQHIAGPFSRSHSPSTSLHHYLSGRRSLPPPSEFENEDDSEHLDLEYDGWGMDSDHLHSTVSRDTLRRNGISGDHDNDLEDSFHEAMLKNDELDFEFDFSLGSLGQSASRFINNSNNVDETNLSLEEEQERNSSAMLVNQDGSECKDKQQDGRSMSILEALTTESELNGLDGAQESTETINVKASKRGKRSGLDNRRSSSGSAVDSNMEEDNQSCEEEEDDEEKSQNTAAMSSSSTSIAQLERKAFERALNTTLCPAAAKLGDVSTKSARLHMKRINSSSSLTFSKSNNPSTRISAETSNDDASLSSPPSSSSMRSSAGSASTINPLLRPPSVSRMNSRDALTSAVPLAELPSIPLEDSRRDSFLFYHLTSEGDPPSYFGDVKKSAAGLNGREMHLSTKSEQDGDAVDDGASSSSTASSSRSVLSRVIKSEEEMDGITDMQVENDDDDDEGDATQRDNSRCGSTASAISRAEVESNDSFNPEMIYPLSARRAPSADLGNIGGEGELDEVSQEVQLHNSRSQSSSRTTSLSPRDSFSPHMVHHGGSYSSEVEADWALTPPSEEEHVDEDEKNLDRATMLGLESVGMEDLDDVWPGVRRSLGGVGSNSSRTCQNLEAQLDGVTCDFKVMEVFEPVLPAAPIPQSDLPSPHLFTLPTLAATGKNTTGGEATDETVMAMDIDQTPMDEHTAAAMFIADESLHPPKPAPIVTVTAATSEAGEQDMLQSSLSPVSAATRDAAITADAQAPASSTVDVMQQQNSAAADAIGRDSVTPTQQHSSSKQTSEQQTPQQSTPPASTQSFLFYPEKPFHPEISILLTDTKILFYSTIVNVPRDGRPLLRRVDNDAVDAEALLLSLEGCGGVDTDRLETLRKIKELGNTWVSLDFARELLSKFGGVDPLLGIFLADDILLAWNEKLVKLGSMLRQKNGLPTSVAGAAGTKREEKSKSIKSANETAAVQASSTATPDKAVAIKKSKAGSVLPQKKKKAEEPEQVNDVKIEPAPTVKSKKEVEILPMTPPSSSSPPKKERTKVNLARRASLRIKGTGS